MPVSESDKSDDEDLAKNSQHENTQESQSNQKISGYKKNSSSFSTLTDPLQKESENSSLDKNKEVSSKENNKTRFTNM